MNGKLLTVSTSPHRLGSMTMRSMHIEIMIALIPALLTGLYYFQPGITNLLAAVVTAVAVEFVVCRLTGLPNRVDDLHAALMGLLLALIIPPGAPFWIPMVGAFLAVVLGKMVFGGLGNYPMNPVLVAWAALYLSWPEHMSAFLDPVEWGTPDAEWTVITSPLMDLKDDIGALMNFEVADLWWGKAPEALGAGGSWALILGGLYLIWRRIISWQTPAGALLGAIAMGILAVYTDERVAELGLETFSEHLNIVWFHLGTGGLMIAAFFLATESVSSPVTPWGMFIFGLGVGVMTMIVRFWGAPIDGAFYGVLLMNAMTPLLDRIRPKVLGKVVTSA